MNLIDPGMPRLLEDTMQWIPRPDAPLTKPDLAEIDRFSLQEKPDELNLSVDERNADEATWVGHFNASLAQCAYTNALGWTAATAGSWHLMHEASANFRMVGGTRGLVGAIAADVEAEIRLESPVEFIAHDADGATISYAQGRTTRAARVVITLPQNMLHHLEVSPALPGSKLRPSLEKAASQGAKAWIRVRGPIKPFFAYSSQHHPLSVVRTEFLGDDEAVLVALGSDSTKIDVNDPEAVSAALKVWRDGLEVLEVGGHDWMADPCSEETRLIQRPGQLTRYHAALQESTGVLHFASGDCGDSAIHCAQALSADASPGAASAKA